MPFSTNPKLPACGLLIHGFSGNSLSISAYLQSSWTCTLILAERCSQASQQRSWRAKVCRVLLHQVLRVSLTNTQPEVLKHPVHTSVAADKRDFQKYLVEENMHVAINLKDFKAVVSHAETANATVTARYTRPCKPLQLEYRFEGINAEFTVMTRGQADSDDVPTSSRATIPRQTPTPIPISTARPRDTRPAVTPSTQMPPPPPRSRSIRPLNGSSTQENLSQRASADRPAASGLSMDFDSLFVPADDDRQWDEMNEEEEPQDILGWDASGTQVYCILFFFQRWQKLGGLTKHPGRIRSIDSRRRAFVLETGWFSCRGYRRGDGSSAYTAFVSGM